jgi:hypothetical protein
MNLTTPPNKSYTEDIKLIHKALVNGENISFSKFCDGEWAVLCNHKINNKEFWFDPSSGKDQEKRKALLRAFQYKNPRYFVGITCVKVFGLQTHIAMKNLSGQKQENLTWADIWVNSNYKYYVENMLPLFKERTVVLFCNENAQIENLPFTPYMVFPLKHNAWEYNWNTINDAKIVTSQIKSQGLTNLLFLFCCGPFGNILCHELTEHEPENTYLDIGSTLNPYLKSAGFERDYYMGNNYFSNMVGVWNQ